MDDSGPLAQPLLAAPQSSFGITLQDLKQIFSLSGGRGEKLENVGGIDGLIRMLQTSPTKGIDPSTVSARTQAQALSRFGGNQASLQTNFFRLVSGILKNWPLCLLVLAGIASLIAGIIEDSANAWQEGTAALLVTAVVAAISICLGYIADKQFGTRSTETSEATVTVFRGSEVEVSVNDLVTGDVMRVETGCVLPADGLVLSSSNLKAAEASPTDSQEHQSKASFQAGGNASESAFLFSGSLIVEGSGTMLVGTVGVHSTLKQSLRREDPEPTGLQSKLGQIACWVKTFGLCVAAAVFLYLVVGYCIYGAVLNGFWSDESWYMLLSSFALPAVIIVISVPEGLFLVAVLSLGNSVRQTKAENMLIRNYRACEDMGAVTDICADKTGTLTQNCMAVVRLYVNGKTYTEGELYDLKQSSTISLLLGIFCINSDAVSVPGIGQPAEQKGTATDCALLELARRWGFNYELIRTKFPSLNQVPFNSQRKWMASVADIQGTRTLYLKGASERIIDLCEFIYDEDQIQPFTPERKEAMRKEVISAASDTLRTIGLAYRQDNAILPESFTMKKAWMRTM